MAFDEDFEAELSENHDARFEVSMLAQSPDREFTEVSSFEIIMRGTTMVPETAAFARNRENRLLRFLEHLFQLTCFIPLNPFGFNFYSKLLMILSLRISSTI